MNLVRLHGIDDVRLDEVAAPTCGPNDVIVDVANCGICGSDIGYIATGGMGLRKPDAAMPLGHEFSGKVATVGANVSHVAVGQRVVVEPTANGTDIGSGGSEGGFAPQILVRDAASYPDAVLPLPDSLSFEQGAIVEPLSVAMHGVNQSGIEPGQSVLVCGAGPIGLCVVIVLRYFGIENIVSVDRSSHRLGLARQLGAAATCNVVEQKLRDVLAEQHGASKYYGAPVVDTDVFIEATGVGAVLEESIALAKRGATIAVIGVHKAPIELHPLTLLMKELHLIGSMAYPEEFPAVIEMLESGKVDTTPLITHRYPLSEFADALAVARDTERAGKVMIKMT